MNVLAVDLQRLTFRQAYRHAIYINSDTSVTYSSGMFSVPGTKSYLLKLSIEELID